MLLPNEILIPEIARLVAAGQTVVFTPSGVSMRPYIEGGRDSVILGPAGKVKVGDIVLAQLEVNSAYVLHRVIGIRDGKYKLMGDGNLQGYETTSRHLILAKVVEIRSARGYRKPLTRAWLWRHTLCLRALGLKLYRKIILKIAYND